jgi:hypothetical protein
MVTALSWRPVMLTGSLTRSAAIRKDGRLQGSAGRGQGGAMEQADIDRVRRVLRQRPKPPWRVLWRGRPYRLQAGDLKWDRGHGGACSCRRAGSCCGRSGFAATLPRSSGSSSAGMTDTMTPSSWPMLLSAASLAMSTPKWRSARPAAGRSTGPTAPPRCKAEGRSSRRAVSRLLAGQCREPAVTDGASRRGDRIGKTPGGQPAAAGNPRRPWRRSGPDPSTSLGLSLRSRAG